MLSEELNKVERICNNTEEFLMGISRFNNPSQISMINAIIRKSKGICCGTSLNGVGKKLSLVISMPEEDVDYIVHTLTKQKML